MNDTILVYVFRVFWALFLGFALVSSFRASWNAEHGDRRSLLWEKNDTAVFVDPMIFPIVIAIYAGACILLYGWGRSRGYLFSLAFDLFFFITVYFSALLCLLPVLRKYYKARTCAVLWLIPVFLFYQPSALYHSMALPTKAVFYIPRPAVNLLLLIWLAGFAVLFGGQIVSHIRFSRKLRRNSRPVEDPELLQIWQRVKRNIGFSDLTRPLALRSTPLLCTPLTIGLCRTSWTTYLPEGELTAEEAELIFAHELHHIQRHDTHTKFFLRFCAALGWMHPLVWLAVRKAEDDLELSCDEIVLQDADDEKKKKYAELLLLAAGDARGYTTCLSASARTLRHRLRAALSGEDRRRLGLGLLFLIMTVSSFCVGNCALTTDRGTVAEVIGENRIELRKASVGSIKARGDQADIPLRDLEEVAGYLEQLEAEKFLTASQETGDPEQPYLYGILADTDRTFVLRDQSLTLYSIEKNKQVSEQYYIRTPVDWTYLCQQ